jgi:hypothetical protein
MQRKFRNMTVLQQNEFAFDVATAFDLKTY